MSNFAEEKRGDEDKLFNFLRWNSYRSERYKLLYVATPKVACTSLKWWFAALEGYAQQLYNIDDSAESDPDLVVHESHKIAPHVTGLMKEELLEALTSDEFFRFAVVRNPYKRVFSAWQSKLVLQEPLQVGRYTSFDFFHLPMKSRRDIAPAFEAFLEHLVSNEAPSFWDHHWASQVSLLRPDVIKYSQVAQIEDTASLTAALRAWLGGYASNPFDVHRANESLIPYHPDFFTERSAELLRTLYAEDFDVYGYDRRLPEANEAFSEDAAATALKGVHLLRARHTQLGQRSKQVARLTHDTHERYAQIADLNRDVTERDGQIGALQHKMLDRDQQLLRAHEVIADHEQAMADLTCAVDERDARVLQLERAARERDGTIGALNREVEASQERAAAESQRLQEILTSKTWRLALCVRKGVTGFRRLFVSNPGSLMKRMARVWRAKSEARLLRKSELFDSTYYLERYPDIREVGVDPAQHYLLHGWRELRDPSPLFGTAQYLYAYPDVAQAQVNPLVHYLLNGRAEGRAAFGQAATHSVPEDRSTEEREAEAAQQEIRISEEIAAIEQSGLFSTTYYLSLNPELALRPEEAVHHYCEHGWREGRNPSSEFDTRYYLDIYADIRNAGINPFWHYVIAGFTEGRHAAASISNLHEEEVFFGALEPQVRLVAFYKSSDWAVVRAGRPLFKGHVQPIVPSEDVGFYNALDRESLTRQVEMARRHGIEAFCFDLHAARDTAGSIEPVDSLLEIKSADIRFCVNVETAAPENAAALAKRLAHVLGDRRYIRFGASPVIVVSAIGDAEHVVAFLSALRQRLAQEGVYTPHLIGRFRASGEDDAQALAALFDATLDLPGSAEYGNFIAEDRNGVTVVPYGVVAAHGTARLAQASASAQDCYPVVVLGRDNSATKAQGAVVYTRFNVKDYRCWLDAAINSTRRLHQGERRMVFLDAWNDWNEGVALEPDWKTGFSRLNETTRALVGLPAGQALPKVTVIVPNYNHEPFLRRRLDSIYGQSYRNIEVLLMDDCSSDQSRVVLDEYAAAYPEITRRLDNEVNSGGVFRQWAKGIKAASGKLVWIAESDDYCDERFLERLVRCFEDEAVLLAYGFSSFVNRDEVPMEEAFHGYVSELENAEKWRGDYVETAHNEVRTALGIKNTIPNASSVLFRRSIDMPLLQDESWLSMRVAGDWVFYLHLLRGGKIAYRSDAINFFRRYPGSTADTTFKNEIFYREVGQASRTVAELYDVPLEVLERCRKGYENFYLNMVGPDSEEFLRWYDYLSVLQARLRRMPNIMVTTMGFSPGGAEILPIRIANELKRQGHSVLLLNTGLAMLDFRIREMVRNDVPVVTQSDITETRELIQSFGIEALNSHQWHIQKYPVWVPDVFDNLRVHVASLHGMIEHDAFGMTNEELFRADEKVTTWVYTANKNVVPFAERGLYDEESRRFTKIPNGMMPANILPVPRSQMHIPDDAFVLCCVSRAIPDKGWAETVAAVAEARKLSNRDIRLVLVGNGPVYDEYCQKGVDDFVHLAGFSENSVGHYASADMGIMLTKFKSESFPLTIVDCLFAGKPYIATDVGDIRNMLTEGQNVAGAVIELEGWEVPVKTAAKIIAAFASDSQKFGDACALVKDVAERYKIDMVTSRYVDLFAASRSNERLGMQKRVRRFVAEKA
jgi:glycosyltransferase involved in cell wall biosynthesis